MSDIIKAAKMILSLSFVCVASMVARVGVDQAGNATTLLHTTAVACLFTLVTLTLFCAAVNVMTSDIQNPQS